MPSDIKTHPIRNVNNTKKVIVSSKKLCRIHLRHLVK